MKDGIQLNEFGMPQYAITTKNQDDGKILYSEKNCLTPNEKDNKIIIIPRKKLSINDATSLRTNPTPMKGNMMNIEATDKNVFLCKM